MIIDSKKASFKVSRTKRYFGNKQKMTKSKGERESQRLKIVQYL